MLRRLFLAASITILSVTKPLYAQSNAILTDRLDVGYVPNHDVSKLLDCAVHNAYLALNDRDTGASTAHKENIWKFLRAAQTADGKGNAITSERFVVAIIDHINTLNSVGSDEKQLAKTSSQLSERCFNLEASINVSEASDKRSR